MGKMASTIRYRKGLYIINSFNMIHLIEKGVFTVIMIKINTKTQLSSYFTGAFLESHTGVTSGMTLQFIGIDFSCRCSFPSPILSQSNKLLNQLKAEIKAKCKY